MVIVQKEVALFPINRILHVHSNGAVLEFSARIRSTQTSSTSKSV